MSCRTAPAPVAACPAHQLNPGAVVAPTGFPACRCQFNQLALGRGFQHRLRIRGAELGKLRRRQSQGLAQLARKSEQASAKAEGEGRDRPVYAVGGRFHGFAVTAISSLHERDVDGWLQPRCAALWAYDSSRLDREALHEEIAGLGQQECRELVSRLGVLLGHLPAASPWTIPQALPPATCCDTRGACSDLGR